MATLLRLNVLRYFLNETMALRESPTDGLEKGSVSLSPFRLGSHISTGGRWRRRGEPEPNEESKRLRSDNQVTLKTFGLAIEASCEGSPFGKRVKSFDHSLAAMAIGGARGRCSTGGGRSEDERAADGIVISHRAPKQMRTGRPHFFN
jgi:hypothetical protein